MKSLLEDLNKMGDGLLKIYEAAEPELQEVKEEANCKKGCMWCCYQLVAITFPEGLVLAREILKRPDWKRIARDMRVRAVQARPDVDRATYMFRKLPCPLLDLKEKACRVYDARPAPCRFYFVVSDPTTCSPDYPGATVMALDFTKKEEAVMNYAITAVGSSLHSSLPVMVLYCMSMLVEKDKKKLKYMKGVTHGAPTPHQWMRKMFEHFDTFVGERSVKLEESHELVQKTSFPILSPSSQHRGDDEGRR